MKTIKIGLIPSPDLPADITGKITDPLKQGLQKKIDHHVCWKIEHVVDPLVGSAEFIHEMADKAIKLKQNNNWDYVICLTDLPQFLDDNVVLADINKDQNIAFISIPALGVFPMKQRVCMIIYQIIKEFHPMQKKFPQRSKHKDYLPLRRTLFNTWFTHIERVEYEDRDPADESKDYTENEKSDEYTQEDSGDKFNVHYLITSKLDGRLRLINGMTFANRPWTALISFKKVIMLAFGTGIYITIFPSSWELSIVYTIPRFILLTFVALTGMVTWMIFAHNLWEKPTQKGDKRLRNLYNATTFITLSIIVIINYSVLYILFLIALGIFVPAGLFKEVTDLSDDPSIKYYFQLTWIITSLGTLAGSIGTTSENEEKIRQITYSYRQIQRYYDIQDTEENVNQDDSSNEQVKGGGT